MTEKVDQVLFIGIQTINLAIPLKNVERVLPLTSVRELPETPIWFIGILNLGGEGLAVVDLALRLGLGEPPTYSIDTPIVIISCGGKRAGFICQEVFGVRSVAAGIIQQTDLFRDADVPPFLGIVQTMDNTLSPLLDPERILAINFGTDNHAIDMDPEWLRHPQDIL